MQLTRQGDYAIRTVLHLALHRQIVHATREIAVTQDIPEAFLNKIVQSLAKAGLVNTFRGARGGIKLAKLPGEITMLDVIEAVEGPLTISKCLVEADICPNNGVCPVHQVWDEIRSKMVEDLRNTSFQKLVNDLKIP